LRIPVRMRLLLERTQEIQDVLFLCSSERVEVCNYRVGFRVASLSLFQRLKGLAVDYELVKVLVGEAIHAGAGMLRDGLKQVSRAAIMHEEQPLSQAPQRGGTELVWFGVSLVDPVVQSVTHFVDGKVGKRMIGDLVEGRDG